MELSQQTRVLSGMRPTGRLHLGHYHGVLKNWLHLQYEHECLFMVGDLHTLTTHYDEPGIISENTWDMIIDWLAVGINPNAAHLFIQSRIPEHAELYLLLAMITPLSWLERIPSFKEQQERLKGKDLATYGFLGYALLQSADVLLYKAGLVPVGEDQVPHIELAREIARRFNHLYGREANYAAKAEAAIEKLGKKLAKLYRSLLKRYQEQGDHQALETGYALLHSQHHLALGDKERLLGYLEGGGKIILPEPQSLLTQTAKLPGLDGQKMSKSYHNTIALREESDVIAQKVRTMPTDPARVRRSDPGEPENCPVWWLHKVYSKDDVKVWAQTGCRSAGIGCLDCKQPLIEAIQKEQIQFTENAQKYLDNPSLVRNIINKGCEEASNIAKHTIEEVRNIMGLDY